jgi:hypothetical protein
VTLDWGMQEKFHCNTTMYNITSMKLKMHHKAISMESQTRASKLIPTRFEFLQNKNVIDLRCLPWKLSLNLTIKMLKFKGNIY